MRQTVAVCIPSGELVHTRMVISLVDLLFASHETINVPLQFLMGSNISESRNQLVKRALTFNPDYVLFIDSDMHFPKDALQRLMFWDKDIIGATYCKRAPPFDIIGKTVAGDMPFGGVVEAERLPAGMLLIKASVFKDAPYPWFYETYDEAGELHSEDTNFCDDARKRGLSLWLECGLSVDLAHLAVYPVTIPQMLQSRQHS